MTQNDRFECVICKTHLVENSIPRGFSGTVNGTLNCWQNTVFFNHRPSASGFDLFTSKFRKNLLIGIDRFEALTFDI